MGARSIITRGVNLDPGLVKAAMLKHKQTTATTNRELFRVAVKRWLPVVVNYLHKARVRPARRGNQRPRSFEVETWDALEKAQKKLGFPVVGLLRCCLEMMKDQG